MPVPPLGHVPAHTPVAVVFGGTVTVSDSFPPSFFHELPIVPYAVLCVALT